MTQGRFFIVSIKAFSSASVIFLSLGAQSCVRTCSISQVTCLKAASYPGAGLLRNSELVRSQRSMSFRTELSLRRSSLSGNFFSAASFFSVSKSLMTAIRDLFKTRKSVTKQNLEAISLIPHLSYFPPPVQVPLSLCWPSDRRTQSEPLVCVTCLTTHPGCICTCKTMKQSQKRTQKSNHPDPFASRGCVRDAT